MCIGSNTLCTLLFCVVFDDIEGKIKEEAAVVFFERKLHRYHKL